MVFVFDSPARAERIDTVFERLATNKTLSFLVLAEFSVGSLVHIWISLVVRDLFSEIFELGVKLI